MLDPKGIQISQVDVGAVAGAMHTFTGLTPGTKYNVNVDAVLLSNGEPEVVDLPTNTDVITSKLFYLFAL